MNRISSIFNSTGIGAHVVHVTPELAAQILKDHNHSNRKIKRAVVDKYAKLMANGDWKVTPETICVSVTGRLLQGQHRLLAIIKSGASCNFLFATGFLDDVFDVLDRGAVRTAADALGIEKRLAQTSKLLAFLAAGGYGVTDFDIFRASNIISETYEDLMNFCRTERRLFSSTPMRLSAVGLVMGGANRNYVFELYRNLVIGNTSELPPIGHAVIGSFLNGNLEASISKRGGGAGGARQITLASLGWTLYDPENSYRKRMPNYRNDASVGQLIKATGYEA